MDHTPLHPNLARVAAAYDQVTNDWASGRIPLEEARRRINELVARDDQGTRWRIDADTGNWCRCELDGTWAEADPPSWGLATPDGWDLSGGTDPFADPRRHIDTIDVDITRVTDTASLAGATMRASSAQHEPDMTDRPTAPSGSRWARAFRWVLAVLAVIAATWWIRGCDSGAPPVADSTALHVPEHNSSAPPARTHVPTPPPLSGD